MVEFIASLRPFLPAWLPLALAVLAAGSWAAVSIRYPATVNSRYENAILTIALVQTALFYVQINMTGITGMNIEMGQLVTVSRWVWSWLYVVMIIRAIWAWRRNSENGKK